MPRCPNPRCQTDYPPGTVQCTNPFCQCLLPEAVVAGRYRIETLIGMGGMGAVYRASDTFEVQQVALKVLSFASNAMDIDTAVERFRREARYAHQLRHKNIVPVLNFGQDGKLLYLAMPVITGGTLKALLKAERPLPTPQAQRYINDLADAVDAIHNHPQQIIHRDIKPSNLLIHQDDGRLVVTDFGIARAMQQEKSLTQRGWSLGTEHYIAPEQEHGKAEPASDIYAMGVIAYQMFTGLLPFQAVVRHHAADLPTPSELNNTLPTAIDPVILRAINIDPIKRFRSAREFADALNAALAQEKDTDNDIWMAPTISVGAGQGQTLPLHATSANVIVRTIIPENPCGYCGRENRNTSHFCRHCGRSLDETSPLVTEVCQVGYVGAGLAPASTEQQRDMLLIMQGLCNTLQPPPRPFSLFAIAESRRYGEVELAPNPSAKSHGTVGIGFAPTLAIETIADVLLPLLAISVRTGQAPSQNLTNTPGGASSLSYHSRLQPVRQTDEECIEQWMRSALRQANRVIYHCNADYDTTMASTLASIILYKRHLYLANVGDSRTYHYNNKTGLQRIITANNSTQIPVAATIGANLTSAIQGKEESRHPLTKAGQEESAKQISATPVQALRNDFLGQQYQVSIDLFKRNVEIDDLILLCTQALWQTLNNEQIQKILASGGDTQQLAHTLAEAANTVGGTGNISAIVVRIQ
jgi:serine/threonine protein kinase/serine/threonine protein phosphatase PrpC